MEAAGRAGGHVPVRGDPRGVCDYADSHKNRQWHGVRGGGGGGVCERTALVHASGRRGGDADGRRSDGVVSVASCSWAARL
jgi:hypothetical protein